MDSVEDVGESVTRDVAADELVAIFNTLLEHRINSMDLETTDSTDMTIFLDGGTEAHAVVTVQVVLPWADILAHRA